MAAAFQPVIVVGLPPTSPNGAQQPMALNYLNVSLVPLWSPELSSELWTDTSNLSCDPSVGILRTART
jgi:hypothetical protein